MKTTNTFYKLYKSKKRIVVKRWGSSSSKTYSILQMLFKWLRTWEFREWEWIMTWPASVVRRYRAEVTRSVLRDWRKILSDEWFITSDRHSWWKVIKENKSEMTFSYKWREVEFMWCDDPEKMKWPRRKILYCNEANNIDEKVFKQMLLRTEWPCVLDFNPDDDEVWINTELEQKRAVNKWDVDVIVSTFRDNAFLSKSIVDEILQLKVDDPDMWNVYWNGQYWKIKWTIFEQWKHFDVIDDIPEGANHRWYGQDYWFTNDPSTLIWIYTHWDNVILDEVFWETNLINTYQDDSQKQSSIQWQYEIHGVDTYKKIWADSSEQKSNEELYEAWYNIEGVTKWPWSVISWIKFMKKYKILITKRSFNLLNEFKKYKWAVDKNWRTLKDKEWRPIPLDKFNHWIDASRYWMTHLLWWPDMNNLDFSIW